MKALVRRHPNTTIIWAHTGVGRDRAAGEEPRRGARGDARRSGVQQSLFRHLVGRGREVLVASPESVRIAAALINRFPDRFLFGTDAVAPATAAAYLTTVRPVRAPVGGAVARRAHQGARRELRAAVRRGTAQGARVGSRALRNEEAMK